MEETKKESEESGMLSSSPHSPEVTDRPLQEQGHQRADGFQVPMKGWQRSQGLLPVAEGDILKHIWKTMKRSKVRRDEPGNHHLSPNEQVPPW